MALRVQSLADLEVLCKHLYEGTDLAQRLQAEKVVLELIDSPECLHQCQLLLEQGTTSYAQLLAATCLSKLVSRASPLPIEQRIDIRNYILNYVASQPKLAPFVIQALIQVIAKITKLGWFEVLKDQLIFRNIITDVKKFLQGTVDHYIIGVMILSELTQEMNLVDHSRSSAKHRKIATSFCDTSLKDILMLACSLLKELLAKPLILHDQRQQSVAVQLLKLVLNCLSFDFIGNSADESADDLCTVQIPTTWRAIFLEPETLDLFFDLYHSLPPVLSQLALSCLVQFASTRRSLFSNPERAKYLGNLTKGVKQILKNPQGLSDPGNYHEFCRFLARLKTNYELGELVMVKDYPEVIQLIANFTITSLQHWEFAPNSVHYLLTLWQRLVASVPFVKTAEPHLLDTYAPEITKAYITSRLECVPVVIRDGLEDPLDDTATVFHQLEQLCTVSRCEYEKTCTFLVQLFDQNAQNYQKLLHSSSRNPIEITVQEGRLAWLVYFVGAFVEGRLTYTSTDEHDAMDGELSCRVFQLMSLMDAQLPQSSNEKVELAILWFMDQFHKTYVGDQLQHGSKVYARMSEVLGIADDYQVLETFMTKIVTNLKYWGRCEPVISRTLQFLNDLSVGYPFYCICHNILFENIKNSNPTYGLLKRLVKIEAVKFMLQNHTSKHFPFLGVSGECGLSYLRCRTVFYTALTRLLMVDLGEDEEKFENFMFPLAVSFEGVTRIFNSSFEQEEAKRLLVGLARDLRGIACALNTKSSYSLLFGWLYPAYISVLQRAIELWYREPACTTPILKLMAEFVQNRSHRLNFDGSSPNGILLFREASKMICTYGNQILSLGTLSKDQVYPLKLKGISICYSALKSALCGNYVSFGVFKLYGDNHFDNVLQAFVKMLLSISHSDLLQYRKLSQSYYPLLECLTQDHMSFISSLEPRVFFYILTSISEGLTAVDTIVSSSCCASLDYIVTYLFKHLSKGKKTPRCREISQDGQRLLHFMQQNPDVLQQMMSILLNTIIFEDCRNQWSVSRPLLGLILLNEKYFSELRATLISSQPDNKREVLDQCFRNLMEGVEQNLLLKNRDRFTENMSVFRRDVAEALHSEGASDPGTLDAMS
ncbi:ran-binding protein 17 isoform B [Patagioenas fasciata monilis]|uniref:Ran-binding protein 17 isoform B n=1 Tax=Patagioenas fasciata monilis TaxID=372326 RepID=A0A1V4KV13_PATFA|nr:ran-binding protein 17 isoform B [Patagioenas fasciata monilis]